MMGKDNHQTRVNFVCVGCGYTENIDMLGVINVLKRGQALLAGWYIGFFRAERARCVCEVNCAVRQSATETHQREWAEHR